jgi:hypothetical protein
MSALAGGRVSFQIWNQRGKGGEGMAAWVSVPTLQQWGCVHAWSVRHTRRLGGAFPSKRRYYRCLKCALHVVTEERVTERCMQNLTFWSETQV